MRPIQVWVPWLGTSLERPEVARDAKRAFQHWRGEQTVYLLPDLGSPVRWAQKGRQQGAPPVPFLAFPSELRERLDVFHIGPQGAAWGPAATQRFPGGTVVGLLDQWLNLDVTTIAIVAAHPLQMPFPAVGDDRAIVRDEHGVRFAQMTIEIEPDTSFPMELFADAEKREFSIKWPPRSTGPISVSPDAESAAATPPRFAAEREGFPGAVDAQTKQWHPHLLCLWPAPFGQLIGPLAGLDTYYALAQMRGIVGQARTDARAAVARARALMTTYVSEGESTLFLARFCPDLAAITRLGKPVVPFWETYGIRARDLTEASQSEVCDRRVSVVRAWGAVGLFWALLVDALESERGVGECRRCGRILLGRRKQCAKQDDEACWRSRRAEDQRRIRTPKRSRRK